MLKEGLIP